MKYPKIGYIDDGAPNAFTYGRTKNDARIVLTRGIFELLTEEEVPHSITCVTDSVGIGKTSYNIKKEYWAIR